MFSPMKSPRRPGLEQEFDLSAATAYNRMGRGMVFTVERRLALEEIAKIGLSGAVLDVGCGPGYLLKELNSHFPGLRLIGLDFNPDVLAIARKNLDCQQVMLVCGDASDIPFGSETIDVIISTGTFHHYLDAQKVLAEFFRTLKPGGTLFLMDLRRDCPRVFFWLIYVSHWFMPAPTRRTNGPRGSYWASYTLPEISRILSASPFKSVSIKGGFGWFFVNCIK